MGAVEYTIFSLASGGQVPYKPLLQTLLDCYRQLLQQAISFISFTINCIVTGIHYSFTIFASKFTLLQLSTKSQSEISEHLSYE